MSDPRVSAMGERTEQDRQAAGATINARIDALADRRLSAATGPLPLHGPYLADQAFHHGVLAMCAAILARP